MEIKWVINAYNGTLDWIKEYTSNYVVYDKKDKNVGYNIYDYTSYVVDNYNNLPDVVVFIKDNVLERHITKKEFDKICRNTTFTPILTQHHKTDGVINYYQDGLYYEKNNSWYFNHHPHQIADYGEFSRIVGLPNPDYLGFAPGGCYIVPRENILKHDKEFYKKLQTMVAFTQHPAEAHAIERSLHTIWS